MVNYVIIGNGVAGTTAAEQIRKRDRDGTITLITQEPHSFYSRIRLIDFLADEATLQDIILKTDQWYQKLQITLATHTHVTQIDPEAHTIMTDRGKKINYDKLLLATGGHPFIPPISGANKEGVFSLRTIQDAQAIKQYRQDNKNHILLVGGGVLGLEAGNALRKTGSTITVVEFFPRLLPRQMDPRGAQSFKPKWRIWDSLFILTQKSKRLREKKKLTVSSFKMEHALGVIWCFSPQAYALMYNSPRI
jgi:nitrite reductase (NADH) large subunit